MAHFQMPCKQVVSWIPLFYRDSLSQQLTFLNIAGLFCFSTHIFDDVTKKLWLTFFFTNGCKSTLQKNYILSPKCLHCLQNFVLYRIRWRIRVPTLCVNILVTTFQQTSYFLPPAYLIGFTDTHVSQGWHGNSIKAPQVCLPISLHFVTRYTHAIPMNI